MIPKPGVKQPAAQPAPRREKQPLDIQLTVRFNFGDTPADAITVIENQSIPMVNSVFDNRDRIMRNFIALFVKTGLSQPRISHELFPVMKLLRKKK